MTLKQQRRVGHSHGSQDRNGVGQPVTAVKACNRAIVVEFRNR